MFYILYKVVEKENFYRCFTFLYKGVNIWEFSEDFLFSLLKFEFSHMLNRLCLPLTHINKWWILSSHPRNRVKKCMEGFLEGLRGSYRLKTLHLLSW
jgi:hypothetical protein